MLSDVTSGPLRGQMRIANLNVITRLLLVIEVCNVKPTNRKSWTKNSLNLKVLVTRLLLVLDV